MTFDYIFCGPEESVQQWPQAARRIGLITEINSSIGYIRAGDLSMDFIRCQNLNDFVDCDAEAAVIITRKPAREKPGFDEIARKIVTTLQEGMSDLGVEFYEPTASNWARFAPSQSSGDSAG